MSIDLNVFNTINLFEAATNLFQQLNIKLNSNTAEPLPTKDILKHHYKDNDTFKAIDKTYFIGIIDDSVFQAIGMFDIKYSYKQAIEQGDKNYNGLMLFALELSKHPTRTEIAELTRAFNRISQKMPVALVLKYTVGEEAVFSIAISERFKYRQNWRQGEKAGKVIILRDIQTKNPHAGHIRILQDLVKPVGVSTYDQLHQHWLQVLDVSILNKKFYQELSNWYFAAMNAVSFPDDLEKNEEIRNATNLIRLITRVIFIWFIKEKQLVPANLFRKEFVASILKDFNKNEKSHNYYNAILQNLFFGTLNQKMEERKFAKEGDFSTNKEEYGVKNLFRYADLFTIPENEVLALFKDIPFLNGGLFDCLDKPNDEGKIVYVDGFSRNPKKKAIVPDYLFFGEEKEVDLNQVYGTKNKRYSFKGLFNLLESYKFTVAENTPVEEEIALDPELLGKVFENLLASYNPETQTTARKQTGSFYTPREIVDYMVDESLIAYLKQNLKRSPPDKGEYPQGEGVKIFNKPEFKTFRRELRKNLTPAEAKLWTLLQGKQLDGRKFRRQYSVDKYVLDFYCPEEKLAIELDGEGHFTAAGADYDAERDAFLEHYGIKVLRFENKWVWDNPDGLLEEIKSNFGWKNNFKPLSPADSSPLQWEQLLENKLRKLFSYEDNTNYFDEKETKDLIEALHNCKILDPACGSGAFPMGILHKMVHILQKLDPENKYWKELQRRKAIEETEAAFKIGDKEERARRLAEINDVFENNASDYGRKLYLIENCIYGIDIQPIAVQIAKLRFFISLVIDQKVNKDKENFGIRSLPNLETKFVAANTLIGLDRPQQTRLRNPEIETKENELKELRHKYFTANTRKEKIALQKQDKKLRQEIARMLESDGWETTVAKQIVAFDPYDQNHFANWFDPEWMFGLTTGFDIVIGNPPYIQLQKAIDSKQKVADLYKNQKYQTFERTGDIYCLFYEKGMQLLKPNGILTFITSNKWMRAGYGEKLREFFSRQNPLVLVDLGPNVFESATVDTNILIIQKAPNKNKLLATTINENKKDNINIAELVKQYAVTLTKIGKDAWFIGSGAEQKLKEKIERIGKPLKEWDVKIYRGILTGLNEAFIITTEKRNEILANCRDEEERRRTEAIIKPILRGRDIKRYSYEWAGLWVIVIPAGWTNENRGKENPEIFIRKTYSSLMEYLSHFETKAKKRYDQGDYWWELRHCDYYPEFEKEKVVWQRITQEPTFCMVEPNVYVLDSMAFFTGKNLKYIMALLNSKLIYHYVEMIVHQYGFTGFRLSNQYVEIMPLPPLTPANQPTVRQIESRVDKILTAKKQNKNADTSQWEKEIDNLVYSLYGLSEEEVRIVENQ